MMMVTKKLDGSDVDVDADAESLWPEGGDGNVAHADLGLILSKQMVVI